MRAPLSSAAVVLAALLGCSRDVPPMQPTAPFQSELTAASRDQVRELDVCRPLEGAIFKVEEVRDGALITIRPTGRTDSYAIHDGVRELDRAVAHPERVVPAGESGCDLGELAVPGVRSFVERTSDGARVRITSSDGSRVDAIRASVRNFVDELD